MKNEYSTTAHKILEISAWLFIGASFAVAIYGMKVLPSTVATHFRIDGTPDSYGSPAMLLLMPLTMIPCLGTISIIAHFVNPESYNMPFKVRGKNKVPVYRCILTMMYAMEWEIAAFTLYVQFKSFQQSAGGILPALGIFMGAMAVTIVGACKRASRYNQKD